MVILLLLRSSHLARYYEPTLRILADRGHLIHIGFPSKAGDRYEKWVREYTPVMPGRSGEGEDAAGVELLSRMSASHPNISWGYLRQQREDRWDGVLTALRICHDYLRFFDDTFKDAGVLRDRALGRGVPAPFLYLMQFRLFRSAPARRAIRGLLALCQRAVPVSQVAIGEIMDVAPDLVLVARLVDFASAQDDYVHAAHYLGIPVGLPVASWDNLTNKGLIRIAPDFITVWNEFQRREAIELHGIAEYKVQVTGAQPFDVWFDRQPSVDRVAFCHRFGFDPEQALIAYLGSSKSIAGYEVDTVRRWLTELRSRDDPLLSNASIIIRPHPYHAEQWEDANLSEFGPVEVWPRGGVIPLTEQQRNDFYDTLFHASAIVGLNTSAQVEAAILGRPVLVLIDSQEGVSRKGTVETLHFRYLSDAERGIATVADSVAEHFQQLSEALRRPISERGRRFVEEFLRPHGIDRPAAPILADAFEDAARTIRKRPELRAKPMLLVLRALLFALNPALTALQHSTKADAREKKQKLVRGAMRDGGKARKTV